MSHFQTVSIKLTLADVEGLIPVFMGIADRYSLQVVQRETVTNRYNVSVFMLLALTGNNIPPVGLTPGRGDEVLLSVDFETNHRSTLGVTREVFQKLTEAIKDFKTKKALQEALKLKSSNAHVNVVVH